MASLFALAPNGWSLFLIAPAAVSFWLAIETSRPKFGHLGKMFSVLTLSLGWWSLTYALELGSIHEEGMRFWLKAEYFAIPLVAPMMYLILREFLGMPKLRPSLRVGLWFVPATTFLLQTTNEFHHLFYESIEVFGNGSRSWLSLTAGPWYIIDAIYVCGMGAIGVLHLLRRFPPRSEPTMRKQFGFVLIAVILPYVGFILFLGDWFWAPDIDLTTYFFLASGILLGVGIFWFQLFDLLPVALERVFERIGNACLVFDYHGRLVKANQSAKDLLGLDELPIGETSSRVFEAYPALNQTSDMADGETVRVTIGGGEGAKICVASRSNIEDSHHHRTGYLLVIRDDTAQLRMEQELRNLNAEKDKLFSVIGHDLRGSLGGLENLSGILSQADIDLSSEESRELLKTMQESAAATSAFLENLLFWAKMQRGKYTQQSTCFPVSEVVQQVRSYLAASLTSKEIELEESSDSELELTTDRTLLETCLRNLLSNAVKFSPKRATVHLRVFAHGVKDVCFEVEDHGIGIPEKLLRDLWEISARNGRAGTEGEPSSGLGLVLVREAVESLGGTVEVQSEEEKGTLFRVLIPRCVQDS
ncbi:sensor histidine kinase [Puniceicoccus vermicola]|uniref:histidine kinase n=1 Tax=Puniceicoccus vermicola TaxID=388746 RepID=A0A7X1AX72_9BACT|nr:histidine kinase N-terminal 7TM domain-containing protein [Puniceicoccus vermicola]MBC2601574.1 hypothetical protein [Puniceicoccus vermicola]